MIILRCKLKDESFGLSKLNEGFHIKKKLKPTELYVSINQDFYKGQMWEPTGISESVNPWLPQGAKVEIHQTLCVN